MIVFLISLALLTQKPTPQPQSCPLEIAQFRYDGETQSRPGHATLKLTNTTSKTVKAAIMKLAAIDAVGDVRDFAVTPELELTHAVKPGETRKATWDIHTPEMQKLKVWVNAVRFDDGTVWRDDGSHSCSKQ